MSTRGAVLILALGAASWAQTSSLSQGPHRLEITLEREEGDTWRAVDPGLVFEQDDRVRFKVRANFDGFLYVTNQTSSGTSRLLFPGGDTGRQNRLEAGRQYLIPATEGWFRITGPPGHEVVYWLMSPLELSSEGPAPYVPLPPPPKPGKVAPNLIPRCDETILRARGDCVDTSAGPKPGGDVRSRDLTFMRRQNSAVVAAPAALSGPVVFEFRLAHR
jgi:hypothetical protein